MIDGDTIELFPKIEGKTVLHAVKAKTKHGYDVLVIEFTDGSLFGAEEQGQVGYFDCYYVDSTKRK